MENSIVRHNLLTVPGYSPYCGGETCKSSPRTRFDGHQFRCACCGWSSSFPADFIERYLEARKTLAGETSTSYHLD